MLGPQFPSAEELVSEMTDINFHLLNHIGRGFPPMGKAATEVY
jgi:hypothetical protein